MTQNLIGALRVVLGLDSAAFEKGADKVASRAAGLETQLGGMSSRMSGLGTALAATLGGIGVTGALAGLKSIAASIGDIGDQAANLGMTTDQFQKLAYAFTRVGITADEFGMAMNRFTDGVGEAQRGTGALKDVFDRYGIALTNADGSQRGVNDLFRDFAEALKDAKSEQEQMTMARDAFGKSGAKYLEVLRDGKGGLDAFGQAAIDAGAVIDEKLIQRADEFDAKWNATLDALTKRLKEFALLTIMPDVAEGRGQYLERMKGGSFPPGHPGNQAAPGFFGPPKPGFTTGGGFGDGDYLSQWLETNRKPLASLASVALPLQSTADAVKKIGDRLGDNLTVIEKTGEGFRQMNDLALSFADMGAQAFDRLALGGEKFKDVLGDIGRMLASQLMMGAFTGQGMFGKMFGDNTVAGALDKFFAGGRADGGPIPAGKFALVGERGPELVASGRSPLTVYPNEAFGAGAGATYNIDARGSTMTPEQFRAILDGHRRETLAAVPGTVNRARSRGRV